MDRFVYFIKSGRHVKVGMTTNVLKRLQAIQQGLPLPAEILAVINGDRKTESVCLHELRHLHSRGEWFKDCEELRSIMKSLQTKFGDADYSKPRPSKTPRPTFGIKALPSVYEVDPWLKASARLKELEDRIVNRRGLVIVRDAFKEFTDIMERSLTYPHEERLALLPGAIAVVDRADAELRTSVEAAA